MALISTFAGPSDTGVYSASVQQTLYDMGKAALEKESLLDEVLLLISFHLYKSMNNLFFLQEETL